MSKQKHAVIVTFESDTDNPETLVSQAMAVATGDTTVKAIRVDLDVLTQITQGLNDFLDVV